MIGSARESNGLNFFEDGSFPCHLAPNTSTYFESSSVPSISEIMSWHFRLGHPSFFYLKHLFPHLFINKKIHLLSNAKFVFCLNNNEFLILHANIYPPPIFP